MKADKQLYKLKYFEYINWIKANDSIIFYRYKYIENIISSYQIMHKIFVLQIMMVFRRTS